VLSRTKKKRLEFKVYLHKANQKTRHFCGIRTISGNLNIFHNSNLRPILVSKGLQIHRLVKLFTVPQANTTITKDS